MGGDNNADKQIIISYQQRRYVSYIFRAHSMDSSRYVRGVIVTEIVDTTAVVCINNHAGLGNDYRITDKHRLPPVCLSLNHINASSIYRAVCVLNHYTATEEYPEIC